MILADLARRVFGARHPIHPHAVLSYSQEGEDLVLARLFDDRPSGFYVDVGAHHPTRFSNTYRFYQRGWRGINIDPRSDFARDFERLRPKDINLNWAVGNAPGERTYYEFNEPALNTFDPALAAERDGLPDYRLTGKRLVPIRPLGAILRDHLPAGQRVTFLTVDVEGLDLEVLSSNDWTAYRPEAIVVELPDGVTLNEIAACPISTYLQTHGYRAVSKLVRSAVFAHTPPEK
jgi:FkbM family methyltransferase